MDQIREEMRGILERLVRIHPLLLFISTLVTATQSILWRYRPTPHQERDTRRINADNQHVLVVGPGLGRDDHMQSCARIAFELAKEMDQLGVVVDADGLWLVQVSPDIIEHALWTKVHGSG